MVGGGNVERREGESERAGDGLLKAFRSRNKQAQDGWQRYGTHRQRVTRLLLDPGELVEGRICLLGAGNANDVDLRLLLEQYSDVTLVDLDLSAMQAGIARQQLDSDPRVRSLALDVTGIGKQVALLSPQCPVDDPALRQCLERLEFGPPAELSGPYDVVASLCLMTQLIDGVMMTLGEQHAAAVELLLAVRNQHLRCLVELTRPGGTAVLVTDVVSSTSYPPLADSNDNELPGVVAWLIQQRNFFTGANPFALRAFFQTDNRVAPLVQRVDLTNPWLWDFGPRVYAVCGLVVRRRDESKER